MFHREGDDLHCEVPVSIVTAALVGDIEVGTLGEKVSISIPEGTQSGKTFRLRGKGIKGVRSSYPGDLYCHILVETPVRLSEKQKKLLRELEANRLGLAQLADELDQRHADVLFQVDPGGLRCSTCWSSTRVSPTPSCRCASWATRCA